MQRFLRFALVAVLFAPIVSVAGQQPAHADAEVEHDFMIEFFPHAGEDTAFRDTWGAPRSGGRRHTGTDILSPRGTRIVAVADGTVTFIGEQRLSGYCIKIEHAGGWRTSYLHLNNDTVGTDDGEGGEEAAFAPGLDVGDRVEAGQLIGWVGDSGNAEHTTPHTHFELIHHDEKLNPYEFLKVAWRRSGREAGSAVTILVR